MLFNYKLQNQMNYFKDIVKNVYDLVLEDDFLQPLTQHEIYSVLTNTRRRISSQHRDRKDSQRDLQTDLYQKISIYGNVSAQRQFRILGPEPRYQIISARLKELKQFMEEVSELMMQNFPIYEKKLNSAISEINNMKSLYSARKNSMELKAKLARLQNLNQKSKRITKMYIKQKNLKDVLKTLKQIPQIHSMSLLQLKSIRMNALKSRQSLAKLKCIKGIQNFIEKSVSSQLTIVIGNLEKCLVQHFSHQLYQEALKNYIVAENSNIQYDKLLTRLVEKEIRKVGSEESGGILFIVRIFLRLMINLHGVFKWHREKQNDQQWNSFTKEFMNININLNIQKMTENLSEAMDQCLKNNSIEMIYHCNQNRELLELLYYISRISEICNNFLGKHMTKTFYGCTELIGKKLKGIREKAKNELKQTIMLEEQNSWNRLPVPNDYSHEVIDKTLYQIMKQKKLPNLNKILKQIEIGNKILKKQVFEKEKMNKDENRKRSSSQQLFIKQMGIKGQTDNIEEEEKEEEDYLEIQQFKLPWIDKYERNKEQVKLKKQKEEDQVILCQSNLSILKYINQLLSYAFYYPLSFHFSIDIMFNIIYFYIYSIFNCFISANLKNIIFLNYEEIQKVDTKYLKKRMHYQYPNLYAFLLRFEHCEQVKRLKEQSIRSRVVAVESISYMCRYMHHIFGICGWKGQEGRLERLSNISSELRELIYVDSIPSMCNLKNTQSIIESIKWSQDQGLIKEFNQALCKNFKEFFHQMNSQNKGEVPLHISQKLFSIFWKTQLTIILKSFFSSYRPIRSNSVVHPKNRFENFIDQIQVFLKSLVKDPHALSPFYQKVKNIFPILMQTDWERTFGLMKVSLQNYQFTFYVSLGLIGCSQSCCYLSNEELVDKKMQIQQFVETKLLQSVTKKGLNESDFACQL